ncbi:hypothetical protein GCM10025857_27710 [Alicyclobacillus contaminans]|uniref:helix-turn-helix transcriptional regulator n=1 Tax=Alicyclobacillus contaminans TaxID=392016 RepID=UPI0003FE3364|nr:helix-turn-helix transcriptional regulator [Alicyclobacillus contaminans]GMA51414.1 hypothetical protein GCM10025857_27710 [Alicyclobacillus contaminans]
MEIGKEIRRIRLSKGLTQSEVADGLFDRSYLSQIEHGRVSPSVNTLRLLAERLGTSFESLLPYLHAKDKVNEAERLLQKGKANGDVAKLTKAWSIFHGFKMTDKMLESVIAWSNISKYTPELLDALSTSVSWSTTETTHPSAMYWEAATRLGNCYFSLKLYDRSSWVYKEIIRRNAPAHFVMRCWVNLGSTLIESEDIPEALDAFEQGLILALEDNNSKIMARCYHGMGICYRHLKRWSESFKYFQKAMDIYLIYDSKRYHECQHNICALWIDGGNYIQARDSLDKCLNYYTQMNYTENKARLLEEYVRLSCAEQAFDEALYHANQALILAKDTDLRLSGRLFLWKAIVHNSANNRELARECLLAAQSMLGDEVYNVLNTFSTESCIHLSELINNFRQTFC